MAKGRKMEPRPSSTRGSLSFSSGAIDSKSLAKNSSGSLALVRGLRSSRASTASGWPVDGVRRPGVSGCLRRTFGGGRGPALLVRVLLEDLAPHICAE